FKQYIMKFRIAQFIATGIYSGYLPFMPGTFGTLVAIPLTIALSLLAVPYRLVIVLALIVIGLWSIHVMLEREKEVEDPGYIVIDEIAGYSLGLIFFAQLDWVLLGFGFLLFRFFDIVKPPPVRQLDQMGGSYGVMLDDLMAGIYTLIVLAGIQFFFPEVFLAMRRFV
ncbi:MAG: phosphatidylglycerophosphatase A, partial [Leptospiraceae bacterium]|nr:phosphatidylglycerophosphatase A [Leptospiraceae bacterium]